MLKSLKQDIFVFSGLKTHAQLFEASKQLLTADKTIKAFDLFNKDVAKIKSNYNKNYLEAEYDFAVGSVQMADKWENFSDSERYLLQYRTAGDDKVRITHQPLHNITLPKSDKFWDKFFPPNGWRCRCTTLQVLAHTNEQSNSKEASKKGNKATTQIGKSGKNKLEIFRFNAGRKKVVFPPKHPYRKVQGANKIAPILKENQRVDRKAIDKEYLGWFGTKVKRGSYLSIIKEDTEIRVSKASAKSVLQHIFDIENKKIIKDIEKVIKQSKYIRSAALGEGGTKKSSKNIGKKRGRGVLKYKYYSSNWNGIDVEINMEVMKNSYEQPYTILFKKIEP